MRKLKKFHIIIKIFDYAKANPSSPLCSLVNNVNIKQIENLETFVLEIKQFISQIYASFRYKQVQLSVIDYGQVLNGIEDAPYLNLRIFKPSRPNNFDGDVPLEKLQHALLSFSNKPDSSIFVNEQRELLNYSQFRSLQIRHINDDCNAILCISLEEEKSGIPEHELATYYIQPEKDGSFQTISPTAHMQGQPCLQHLSFVNLEEKRQFGVSNISQPVFPINNQYMNFIAFLQYWYPEIQKLLCYLTNETIYLILQYSDPSNQIELVENNRIPILQPTFKQFQRCQDLGRFSICAPDTSEFGQSVSTILPNFIEYATKVKNDVILCKVKQKLAFRKNEITKPVQNFGIAYEGQIYIRNDERGLVVIQWCKSKTVFIIDVRYVHGLKFIHYKTYRELLTEWIEFLSSGPFWKGKRSTESGLWYIAPSSSSTENISVVQKFQAEFLFIVKDFLTSYGFIEFA